ncbi:MAG: D-tyrosyl-tRNA(Tyr) deacylase [Halobacteriovoraceae bacterium]|jgi:D-aminoacyl-tRNA deacylase|nr:D-tyrosyl-tRNA(Tyr) deacylase [Halobacteriovoraceae bacterium]
MRVLVQRVKSAKVLIDSQVKGEIGIGYLLYVCLEQTDTILKIDQAITKIVNLRIFEDEQNKMNQNISQVKGQILSISQFTLSWDGKKGHRPSFDKSMAPNDAKILYKHFNDKLSACGITVEKGIFGAQMEVSSINDGPVSFIIDF